MKVYYMTKAINTIQWTEGQYRRHSTNKENIDIKDSRYSYSSNQKNSVPDRDASDVMKMMQSQIQSVRDEFMGALKEISNRQNYSNAQDIKSPSSGLRSGACNNYTDSSNLKHNNIKYIRYWVMFSSLSQFCSNETMWLTQ